MNNYLIEIIANNSLLASAEVRADYRGAELLAVAMAKAEQDRQTWFVDIRYNITTNASYNESETDYEVV